MSEILWPAKIMLIRHAEKPSNASPPHGVRLTGERGKESLTVRGWQRAGALATLFAPAGSVPRGAPLARPQLIFVSKPLKRGGSRRPLETVTPLAEKLAIRVNADYPREEVAGMLEEAFSCEGAVLICWQREFIPKIASRILGDGTAPLLEWPEDRFDVVWVFDRDAPSGRYSFGQVPQLLLIGDRATPIQ